MTNNPQHSAKPMWGGCLKTQNTLALCSVPCCLEVPKFFLGGWWGFHFDEQIIIMTELLIDI